MCVFVYFISNEPDSNKHRFVIRSCVAHRLFQHSLWSCLREDIIMLTKWSPQQFISDHPVGLSHCYSYHALNSGFCTVERMVPELLRAAEWRYRISRILPFCNDILKLKPYLKNLLVLWLRSTAYREKSLRDAQCLFRAHGGRNGNETQSYVRQWTSTTWDSRGGGE